MKFRPTYRVTNVSFHSTLSLSPPFPLKAHTYGATPITVGISPLYSASRPPSFLYIRTMFPHMPGSFCGRLCCSSAKDADWIDRRVRTISSG